VALRCCRTGGQAHRPVLSLLEALSLRVRRRKCQEERASCLACFRAHVLEKGCCNRADLTCMRSLLWQPRPRRGTRGASHTPRPRAGKLAAGVLIITLNNTEPRNPGAHSDLRSAGLHSNVYETLHDPQLPWGTSLRKAPPGQTPAETRASFAIARHLTACATKDFSRGQNVEPQSGDGVDPHATDIEDSIWWSRATVHIGDLFGWLLQHLVLQRRADFTRAKTSLSRTLSKNFPTVPYQLLASQRPPRVSKHSIPSP
jgi:hypothetical protein